ncbi:uncharacterized protein EDB93DRAFT_1105229 [Suillus bovinus]|uniref:uncharacterized protein n=1 Tax=Suillus bovinus TaxID=48563 RepID=UPI001B86967D|nr:uncharacterized protein EDB93DRAFT_1105229 [Suillus bovinus]KAG2143558.1 hypothetical protein EDB93DRAFT_1105229 [Suillus bovinus]
MSQATKRPPRTRGRGTTRGTRGQGQAAITTAASSGTGAPADPPQSDTILGDVGADTSSGMKIWQEGNIQCTNAPVQYLVTHAVDCRILFNEGGKKPDDEGPPSGSNKTKICTVCIYPHCSRMEVIGSTISAGLSRNQLSTVVIAQHIFETDQEYMGWYSEDPAKFTSATGAGIDPSQPNASNNLLEQVILEFPWYSALRRHLGAQPCICPQEIFICSRGESCSAREKKRRSLLISMTKQMEIADDGLSPPAPAVNAPPAPAINAPPAPAVNTPPAPAINTPSAPAVNAPPAPAINAPPAPSCPMWAARWAITDIRSPPSPQSITSSSAASSSARTILSSHQVDAICTQSKQVTQAKLSLSGEVQSNIEDMCSQVDSLSKGIHYVYSVKVVHSEYKITKVNSHRQKVEIDFQHKQAELEHNEAAIIHQRVQESKSLEIQLFEAQAKAHLEKRVMLELKLSFSN